MLFIWHLVSISTVSFVVNLGRLEVWLIEFYFPLSLYLEAGGSVVLSFISID